MLETVPLVRQLLLGLNAEKQLLPGYSNELMTDCPRTVDYQQISTESLILAQDERWRRA